VPQYAGTWAGLRDAALRAERLGFHGLWVNDHLQAPGRLPREPTFDALTTLAALAPLTSRAALGVAVLSATYRPPALAAKMATVLDVIAGGRLVVGLGSGSDRREHEAYGIPFASPRERTEAVRRALAVLRAMAGRPEGASLEGILEEAPNLPPSPRQGGPPVWLAAHGPVMLGIAGREADGVVAAFLSPEELARRRVRAERAREAAGRPPLAYAAYLYALPIPSEREADRWLAPEAEALGTTPARFRRWLAGQGIVSEPVAMRERLGEYAAAGATDAILVLPNRVPAEAIEALAEAVLPRPAPAAARRPASGDPEANLAHRLVEVHRAGGRGGAEATVDDAGAWTYDELGAAVARAAGALRAAGVRRGERVAVPLPDGRAWLAGFLGAAWLGAVPVPLDPDAPAERLLDVLVDCEPTAVVADPGGSAAEACAGAWPLLAPADLEAGAPEPLAPVHPDDLAYLIYSSGTTGRPKAAMHAHRDMAVGIETYARRVLGLRPGDRCHSVAKGFTSLGFGNGFFRVLGCGATAVLSARRPTVRSVLGAVGRAGVTVLTAVPTFWAQLATFLERHPEPGALAGVRLGVSSGDALPRSVAERVRRVGGLDLLEGLGCSECSNIVISTRPGEPRPGTLGEAVPGVEIRLADDEGRPVADGEPGRLWIRSDSNTSGYWRRAELTRDLLVGPWLRMADVLARVDGAYRHLGRSDDLFKVDARWVSPVAVEDALLEHPVVAEAAVVGRADEQGLTRPAASVVLDEGAEAGEGLAEELRRHVAHRVAPHAAPATVDVVDALPRLPSGKIDRRRLREGLPSG
jgi:acyl-coenzyme A synthetase/AMP-(fatty) acid ligase/alkanesulfonate monooxygenase SsuD/methylene tetrahydromethanopterin reductase-like flavin-dependent oxidoreductase (luciferase family)